MTKDGMTEQNSPRGSEADKVLVGSIQKFSTEDGPGVRTTVFLKGCPLDCRWCHNPEMIDPKQQMIISPSRCIGCGECVRACPLGGISVGETGPQIDWDKCESCCTCAGVCFAEAITPVAEWMTVADVMAQVLQDQVFYDKTGGGLTISGGELLLHAPFAKALIEACRREGIGVCLDTSGYSDYETIRGLAGLKNVTDILYDMKHIDGEKHLAYTGVSNDRILDNLARLAEDPVTAPKLWMRMPLAAGINDDDETIMQAAAFYQKHSIRRVTLIPYHELGTSKAAHIGRGSVAFSPPAQQRLEEIKETFTAIGMDVEILGGVK